MGDRKMKTPILRKPEEISEAQPALATAAPAMPPTSAWDEEDGSPSHQVIRSQAMAPTRPAKIIEIDRTLCTTTSLAMVLATLVPKIRKAAKLKNAAHTTA